MEIHPPVLVYHRISSRPLLAGTWVTPALLAAQLDRLLAAGCRPLTAAEWLAARGQPRERNFLVTFDDGTEDLYRHRDILRDRGVPAVVFVPGALLGRRNRWEWALPTRVTRHLDAEQLAELIHDTVGWEVGLHGATHRDLTRLTAAALDRELTEARSGLSALLRQEVRLISYPYGRLDGRVALAARRAGFTAGFVVSWAPPHSQGLLAVVRRPVYCIDSAGAVLVKVTDPDGRSLRGCWELRKERFAHAVGRWTAQVKPQTDFFTNGLLRVGPCAAGPVEAGVGEAKPGGAEDQQQRPA